MQTYSVENFSIPWYTKCY